MAHATHTDGELDLEPLKRILERDFRYDTHQDAEELILGACQEAQNLYGWVPQPAAQVIADHLGVSVNRVYSLLTFYADFRTEPRGDNFMLLCHGMSCYVMGSQQLVQTLADRYGIGDGGTTAGGELTVQVVNGCLGVCDQAPLVKVNDDYYGNLTPETFNQLVQQVIAERRSEG